MKTILQVLTLYKILSLIGLIKSSKTDFSTPETNVSTRVIT